MDLRKEHELDKSLADDHFSVLFNYAQHSQSQILLNEFMQTKFATISGVRKHTEVPLHLHDVFDLHPSGMLHKAGLEMQTKDLNDIHYHSTTPLDVDQPQIVADGPYDLVYVNLPYKLPQSPNSVDLVVGETIKLWWSAMDVGAILLIPDYNKLVIRRQVDLFVRTRMYCKTEKYFDTNWDQQDLGEDHFMIAIQKNEI
ncbi:hypothetical protein N9O93_01105 [bacterium]|jgi:hypothetical protein|nr:hypothetical protein [Hellea sp.]MDA9047666.1 hypothetical protein [Hellea sp.]MDA9225269.1 hypothetical protein [bacterium]